MTSDPPSSIRSRRAGGGLVCWAVTSGGAAARNKVLGLAEAIAEIEPLSIDVKQVSVPDALLALPRQMWGDPFKRLSKHGHLLRPPWPDLWISTGRATTPLAIEAKRREGRIFTVQIEDPGAPAALFDVVVAPTHRPVAGDNVLSAIGAPNRVRPAVLAEGAAAFGEVLRRLPPPASRCLWAAPRGGER